MIADGNLQEWLFVTGYLSFLLLVVFGVVFFSSREN